MATFTVKTAQVLEVSERPTDDRTDSFVSVKLFRKGEGVLDAWGFKKDLTEGGQVLPTEGDYADAVVNAYVNKRTSKLSIRLQSITPASV